MSSPVAVVVPVKNFDRAKVRLATELNGDERAALAREMATTVVAAAAPLPVAVVCDSENVRAWADTVGARAIWTPQLGLNGAVQAGVATLAAEGVARVVVAHADLPLADDLAWVATGDGVTIVPDRHLDGTNVIAVPADVGFTFAYGPGSYRAHRSEAERLGLQLRIAIDPKLSWDVDRPADLVLPSHLGA